MTDTYLYSKSYARGAGALYLTIAFAGVFSILYVPSEIFVPGDMAATAANLEAKRVLFNLGILGDVIVIVCEIAATTMLYLMFRGVNRTISLTAALARLSMAGVMAVMLLFHVAALTFLSGETAFLGLEQSLRLDLAGVMFATHDAGVWVWQLFFTLHLALLGILVSRSGAYPRLLGYMMTLGAFGYLLDSIVGFAAPDATALIHLRNGLLGVVSLAEFGFALWLLFRGPKVALT